MDITPDVLSQQPYRCRLEWGRDGARRASARRDILVIVDTLRFSTAVVTAVHHGAIIYPCDPTDDPEALARHVRAVVAAYRQDMLGLGTHPYSLSPLSYDEAPAGTRIVLPSPNGAVCSRYGRDAPYLFVGALVNAAAVGRAVSSILARTEAAVTVIACGERWRAPADDGELRVAIEDYLGSGAILSRLPCESGKGMRSGGAFIDGSVAEAGAMEGRGQVGHVERADIGAGRHDRVDAVEQGVVEPDLGAGEGLLGFDLAHGGGHAVQGSDRISPG